MRGHAWCEQHQCPFASGTRTERGHATRKHLRREQEFARSVGLGDSIVLVDELDFTPPDDVHPGNGFARNAEHLTWKQRTDLATRRHNRTKTVVESITEGA